MTQSRRRLRRVCVIKKECIMPQNLTKKMVLDHNMVEPDLEVDRYTVNDIIQQIPIPLLNHILG